jgi:hypothetical protein
MCGKHEQVGINHDQDRQKDDQDMILSSRDEVANGRQHHGSPFVKFAQRARPVDGTLDIF